MTAGEDRKGKFIAVANMKGGVGKTTTVVSLAEALAADDDTKKILVIDLDPQASASVSIAGDEELNNLIDSDRTFEALLEKKLILKEKVKIADLIHPTICGTFHGGKQLDVSLLPCGPKLRQVEKEMIFERARANFALTSLDGQITRLFKTDILPLNKLYDIIIFDCAPGISIVTEVAIRLSDLVIVPTIPDRLSAYGLTSFYLNIWHSNIKTLPAPKAKPSILIVRMDQRIRQHKEVFAELQNGAAEADAGFNLFRCHIPTSAALVAALMKPEGATFAERYTPQVVGHILNPLVGEIKEMLLMSMEVDGSGILTALAQNPPAFGMTSAHVNTLAVSTLLFRLKDKAVDLPIFRTIGGAVGKKNMALALDQMPIRDVASFAKRLDPKNTSLKDEGEIWLRGHLVKLSFSEAEPVAAVSKIKKEPKLAPPKSSAPKTGEVMKSKALRPRAPKKTAEK